MNKDIVTAILDHFATATGLPTIYFPNVNADLPTGEHIQVDILPANTVTVGLSTTSQARGIINVLIRTEENIGPLRANEIADLVLARFARNTSLTSGSATVRIDLQGYVSPPLGNIDGWYVIAVSIPYNSIIA